MSRSDQEYIDFDPFEGDESDASCRAITIRTARKEHKCFSFDPNNTHTINAGQRYRHERALIDGQYFWECKICLDCIDKVLSEFDDEEEEE